jgi:hypothetical protein
MDLNVQDWKEFLLSKLFLMTRGTRLTTNDRISGSIPLVTVGEENNGVSEYIDNIEQEKFYSSITIDMFNNCFYHEGIFCADDNILVLDNVNMSKNCKLFVSTIINQDKYRYSYGRQYRQKNYVKHYIKLPIKYNLDKTPFIDTTLTYSDEGYVPDWEFMENYIKSLHYKPITTKVNFSKVKTLDIDKWEEFKISDLFDRIYKAKAHTKEEVVEVENGIHFVSRTDCNNGVDITVDKNTRYEGLEEANCITIGDTTATCFYQNERFIAGDHMVVLRADWLNLKRGLFIRTLLAKEGVRYSYGRAYRMDLIKDTILRLPIQRDKNGNPIIDSNYIYSEKGFIPDWEFMEEYIKSLPYSDRII